MIGKLKNVFLITIWIFIITFPLLGLKSHFVRGEAVVQVRADAFWLAGIIFLCGVIWCFKDQLKKALSIPLTPFKKPSAIFINKVREVPRIAWILVLLFLVLGFPLSGAERDLNKYLSFLTETFVYIALALGLNIVVGMAGLLVLGYAAFFGIGAYTYALLSLKFQIPFWPGLICGGCTAGTIGILLGIPSIRLRGDYLAIVTLGFGEVIRFILKNEAYLTGGEKGLPNEFTPGVIAPPAIGSFELGKTIHFYYVAVLLMVLIIFLVHRLNNSRIGRAWIAIREDETAAMTMGINTFKMKILAFALSAFVAGVMGVFYASRMNFVNPEAFRFEYSVLILSMVILGGMGSVPGVILGATVLQLIPWLLRDIIPTMMAGSEIMEGISRRLPDFRLLIFSAIMILMMIFRPQGLIGSVRRKIELKAEEKE
jgi:branched-chain amino acid transport system permease protein